MSLFQVVYAAEGAEPEATVHKEIQQEGPDPSASPVEAEDLESKGKEVEDLGSKEPNFTHAQQ